MTYLPHFCKKHLLFIGLLLTAWSSITSAQRLKLVNDPYSYIGLGTLHPTQFASQRAMGGFSAAYVSPLSVNYSNPASYPHLALTTYEIGVQASGLWLSSGLEKSKSGSGGFDYLAFGFPVAKWWGTSIGLLPYVSTHYDLKVEQPIGIDSLANIHRFTGSGTMYQVYWGNGFAYKGFSVGANVAFLFAAQNRQSLSYLYSADSLENNYAFGTLYQSSTAPHGFVWNAGLQYDHTFEKELHLTIGVTGNTTTQVAATRNTEWRLVAVDDVGNVIGTADTVSTTPNEDGKLTLPMTFSGALALRRENKWQVGGEVRYDQWTDFRNFGVADTNLTDNLTFKVGFEITPDIRATTKFWRSTHYRAGFRYSMGSLQVQGERLPEFAVTAGLGLPLRKVNSRVNLTLEVGQRGSTVEGLIRQTFVVGTLGFSLNDRWFIKPKYD